MNNKWDERFLELASFISSWSKDPSTQCGAVIVDKNKRVISLGYNGFAQGVEDTYNRWNIRETKIKLVIHAEENAINFAKQDISGMTMYLTGLPCSKCASTIIQSGINKVVCYRSNPEFEKRWGGDLTRQIFNECNVVLVEYDDWRIKGKISYETKNFFPPGAKIGIFPFDPSTDVDHRLKGVNDCKDVGLEKECFQYRAFHNFQNSCKKHQGICPNCS